MVKRNCNKKEIINHEKNDRKGIKKKRKKRKFLQNLDTKKNKIYLINSTNEYLNCVLIR